MSIDRLGFGGAALSGEGGGYGFGAISEQQSQDLLHEVIQSGIGLIDVAPIYGFGLAEKRLGKALKGRRDRVRVISKAGVTWDGSQRVDVNNSPQVVLKMLEQSLQDLQTDYIDDYLIHWPDPRNDIRAAMEVLAKAQEQGKIRRVGLSNTNLGRWRESIR